MPQAVIGFRTLLISTYPFVVGACLLFSAWLSSYSIPTQNLESDLSDIEAVQIVIP